MSVDSETDGFVADMAPVNEVPRSAYVHVPFCARRCGYCDFTVVAGKDHLIEEYLVALQSELASLRQPRTVDTLYVGGGTPTQLNPEQLRQLMQIVCDWLPVSSGGELTVEANPGGFDQQRIDVLAEHGVNRISLGVQSFVDRELIGLERDHRVRDLNEVIPRVRKAFKNVSLDLMFATPGQSPADWVHSLREALRHQVDHISTYGLTYEKGTAFWSRLRRGTIQMAPDGLQRELYGHAMDLLADAGFEQYEISSFARLGYASRHNQVYWSGHSYWGFGPGAARYVDGWRETNHRSATTWMKRIRNGVSPIADRECLSVEDRARERLALGLRTCRGVCTDRFSRETGCDVMDLAGQEVEQHIRRGWLEWSDGSIRLTREGRFMADSVIVDML